MAEIMESTIERAPVVVIGPGCTRRDLPSFNGNRAWVVEIEAGHEWPFADHHDEKGELVLVLSGELLEGDRRYAAGSYLIYGPHSVHTPSTRTGVRLFGLNAAASSPGC